MKDERKLAQIRDIVFDSDMMDSEKINEVKHILNWRK